MGDGFDESTRQKVNGLIDNSFDIHRLSEIDPPHIQFGHYTNRVVRLYRYYSKNGEDVYGINTPFQKIVTLSQFLALYDQNWDVQNQNIYNPIINNGNPVHLTVNGNAVRFNLDPAPNLQIGYCMHLLNSNIQNILTHELKTRLVSNATSGLEKYFGSQLIHCFLIGTGIFGDDLGMRVYWDDYSLNILTNIHTDIPFRFTLTFRSILMFFIRQENIEIVNYWNRLVELLLREFPVGTAGIEVTAVDDINSSSEIDETGLPIHPTIRNIIISFNNYVSHGSTLANSRLAAFIKLYQLFTCHRSPEQLALKNKYFEFYTYQFINRSYVTRHGFQIPVAGHAPVISSFWFSNHQGFIGQAFRYIALSQRNYRLIIPDGGAYDINSPTIIHIRDSHHACPTVFERALMDTFENSGKRYFFTSGTVYAQPWHHMYVPNDFERFTDDDIHANGPNDHLTVYNPQIFDRSRLANGTEVNRSRSCWAGLQSFRKLVGDECAFGNHNIFRKTMGIIFHHHELPIRVKNILYGINNTRVAFPAGYNSNLILFCYGIDERLLANCFFPILHLEFNEDGRFINCRKFTPQELDWAQRYRSNNTRIPECNIDVLNDIFSNMLFYIIDLDIRAIDLNKLLKGDVNIYNNINLNTFNNRLLYEICAYLLVHKSFPKTPYDLIKNTEDLRNKTLPVYLSPIHKFTSIYHCGNTLFRSYNQQWWSQNLDVKYNLSIQQPTSMLIHTLIEYIQNYGRTHIRDFNTLNSEQFVNYINNYNSFYKILNANRCRGTLANYIEHRREHCMTQPINYVREPFVREGKALDWPGYKYRGIISYPSDGIPRAMVPMIGGRRSKKLKRNQRGGNGSATLKNHSNSVSKPFPNKSLPSKLLDFKINTSKLKSNKSTVSNKMPYDVKILLNLIAYKDVLTVEDIKKDRIVAMKILETCISSDISNIAKIMKIAYSMFPFESPSIEEMNLYYDPPLNASILQNINTFFEKFKLYVKEYNNTSNASNYFDIYFNLETKKPIVHFSNALDSLSSQVYEEMKKMDKIQIQPFPVFKNQASDIRLPNIQINQKKSNTTKRNKKQTNKKTFYINNKLNSVNRKTLKKSIQKPKYTKYRDFVNPSRISLQPAGIAAF